MFRFILNGGLQNKGNNISKFILYSTKHLPKNAVAMKSNPNYVSENEYKSELSVNKIKTVSFDEVSVPNQLPKILSDNDEAEKDKAIINWQVTPLDNPSELMDQYLMLSKIRLTTLVVITTVVGYSMSPAPFDPSTFICCTIGTGLCSAAANAVNQYHEVPYDAQMSRTKNRVLVRGQLTSLHAIVASITSAALGTGLLYFGVNGYAAALGAANLFLYTSIYTPMKRVSILNTWIGSVVGAIPPLIGWVGCSGSFDTGSILLAAIMYSWQFPHFNALSWNLRPDYSRAGYRMMSVSHPALCRRTALRHTIALTIFTAMAPLFDITNIWFLPQTLPLNAYFVYLAYKFYKKSDSGSSRKLFRFSLVHLPVLMILFIVNKKQWASSKQNSSNKVTTQIQATDPAIVASTVKAVM